MSNDTLVKRVLVAIVQRVPVYLTYISFINFNPTLRDGNNQVAIAYYG
ncbi:hypothetical protein [Nostoc sp. UHCC 0302]